MNPERVAEQPAASPAPAPLRVAPPQADEPTGARAFRPRRVLAVDLESGAIEYPDPERRPDHPDARVLVRWLGEQIDVVQVTAPDDEVVRAAADAAWATARAELTAAAERLGVPAPTSAEDLLVPRPGVPAAPGLPADRPLVTVTIASLRNVEPTIACVRRVLTSSWEPLEVVVVDNDDDGEPLRTAMDAAFAGDDRVRWVHEPRRGLSFARNKGLEAARGEIVVFTDDDVLVDHRWVERLVAGFGAAEGVACVTGAILPAEQETVAQVFLEEYGGFHKGFARQVFNLTDHRRESPLYPYDSGQFGSGANMAFRTQVLRDLGGFAIDLGAGTVAWGGEDLDVLRRTISAGHTVVYEPAALMWHYHRRSMEALRKQMYRYGVGLSATVTKWVFEDRKTAVDVLRRIPRGVAHVARPGSAKNKGKSAEFPRVLTALELLGVLVGPVAYLRSRRRTAQRLAG
ncbi:MULTISPECIES: glycosyltransferase [unclassified Geodermatophilus]|uniref:glycosyltransferase n=1 Tax=unclassified Geodermatophilus TaxID=2637632 RepID=UPI003EEB2E13